MTNETRALIQDMHDDLDGIYPLKLRREVRIEHLVRKKHDYDEIVLMVRWSLLGGCLGVLIRMFVL